MAAIILRALATRSQKCIFNSSKATPMQNARIVRYITTTEYGEVLPRPQQVRFGLLKVTVTVTPFLLGGATLSREFAAWLEEHELFVPDDDDD